MDFFIKPDGHRQAGFSLIEVLIAAGVLSVLSLAMANLVAQQRKSTAYLERQLAKVQLIRNIETILKDGISCQNTLVGTTLPAVGNSVNIGSLRDNGGAIIYRSNHIYNRLQLGQIEVKNATVSTHSSTGFVDMIVPIKLASAEGPKALRPGVFRISVSVDSSNIVSGCSGTDFGFVEDFECSLTSTNISFETCTVQSDVDTKFCAIRSSPRPHGSEECSPHSFCEVEDPDSQGRWQLKGYSKAALNLSDLPAQSNCTCKMICIR